jgi:hypothetical protein
MINEAKGARKKALELMSQLRNHNEAVVLGSIELEKAQLRLNYVTSERNSVMVQLTDLINRCMESFGSDEGK